MARKKVDKFAELPEEYKSSIVDMFPAEIRQRISQIAIEQLELAEFKKNDADLMEKREALRYANEVYDQAAKFNKLKIEFAKRVLDERTKIQIMPIF